MGRSRNQRRFGSAVELRSTGQARRPAPPTIQVGSGWSRPEACATGLALLLVVAAFGAEGPRQKVGNYQVTLRAGVLYSQEESQIEFRIEDLSRPDPLTGYTPV